MCPQTPADQHSSPVLSHPETYGPVCTFAPQPKQPLNLSSFQCKQVLSSSCSGHIRPPQAADNLLQTCAICDLPPPERLSTSFLCPGSSPSSGSSSLKSSSCFKLFCRAVSPSCRRCYFPPTTYQVLRGLTLIQDKL